MSNTDQILEISSKNYLFVELNDQSAETISGGAYEVFTIGNKTSENISYNVDKTWWFHRPNEKWVWTTFNGGKITFDQDIRSGSYYKDDKTYNLSNGGEYAFGYNNYTSGNPFDIDLYLD